MSISFADLGRLKIFEAPNFFRKIVARVEQ